MFDSREYQWSDVSCRVGTTDIVGLRAVSYKKSKEKELLYGKGNEPIAVQSGNVSYEGSLTVLQSEYESMKAAGGGSILDLITDITVCYGNPDEGSVMITDVLMGVQFTEEPNELSQGDKNGEHALPFVFLRKKRK